MMHIRGFDVNLPAVTLSLAAWICFANLALLFQCPHVYGLVSNIYEYTRHGQVWRLATSWVPHDGMDHLVWDSAYLILVGSIVETLYGRRMILLVFFSSTISGGLVSTWLDQWYSGSVGSSAGTHGLAVYFCTREILKPSTDKLLRVAYCIAIAYLLYLIIAGLQTGSLGWPFTFFRNSGFDHLGGVVVAVVLAFMPTLKGRCVGDRGDNVT